MIRSSNFRRKPTGWRGESFRHYLAAKGIRTKIKKSYFVRDELKGNRSSSGLHRAYSKGFSKEDLRQDESARNTFGISLEELSKKRRQSFPEDLSQSEEVALTPELSEGEPLPDITTTSESTGEDIRTDLGLDATTEPMIMSPGVPPAPSGPDSAFFAKKSAYKVKAPKSPEGDGPHLHDKENNPLGIHKHDALWDAVNDLKDEQKEMKKELKKK